MISTSATKLFPPDVGAQYTTERQGPFSLAELNKHNTVNPDMEECMLQQEARIMYERINSVRFPEQTAQSLSRPGLPSFA